MFYLLKNASPHPLFLAALAYLIKLSSYLDPAVQGPGHSTFVRCWHAKRDGWAASTFHSNCGGKGPTITIVQVVSYIFGGYTDKSWGGMYHFINALIAHRCSRFLVDGGENDSNTLRVGAYLLCKNGHKFLHFPKTSRDVWTGRKTSVCVAQNAVYL